MLKQFFKDPGDNSDMVIDILPADFDANGFCIVCGGALGLDFTCERCGADHWPAINRNRSKR